MTTEIEYDENGERIDEAAYLKEQAIQFVAYHREKKSVGRYQVTVHPPLFPDSPVFHSKEECEQWVSENLPVSIQKCRTACYYIDKVEEES